MKSGDLSQGGSTLTMQTVDNFIMKPVEDKMQKEGKYFSTKEKIERKIQEIYLSMCLDDELSKEDIMTRYLNQINFGQHTRGIQKGAQYYFGKNVEDLNLSESAFLAGVILSLIHILLSFSDFAIFFSISSWLICAEVVKVMV